MSTAPNMATITAALERSLQNCSLSTPPPHHHHHQPQQPLSAISDSQLISNHHHHHHHPSSNSSSASSNGQQNHHRRHLLLQPREPSLDLNSHISLPYHWEQCLDLKTGEIYYINWRNGMKAKEDPRSITEDHYSEDYYYYSDDDSSCDSEESSTESSNNNNNSNSKNNFAESAQQQEQEKEDHVLVVAGCKSCLMYFMVPKHLEDCPKCSTGQLLHFDRSENEIP